MDRTGPDTYHLWFIALSFILPLRWGAIFSAAVDILWLVLQNDRAMANRSEFLEERIQSIKREIFALGDLRPGALSLQYNVCGTPSCRCRADPPIKHGPYPQISFTWHGKSTTRTVRADEVDE